jgi:hypothetical protein
MSRITTALRALTEDLHKIVSQVYSTRPKQKGGIGGMTIEANLRSSFHEISSWDVEQLLIIAEALTEELDKGEVE